MTPAHSIKRRKLERLVRRAFYGSDVPALWTEVPSPTLGARVFVRGRLAVLRSIDRGPDGSKWIHVSVSHRDRIPRYEEVAKVKELFIGRDRQAFHLFPAASEHVNHHPRTLHLWSKSEGRVMPDMRKFEPCLGELSV